VIFLGALFGIEPGNHRFHLVIADVDERLDLAAEHPLPGHLAADLALE